MSGRVGRTGLMGVALALLVAMPSAADGQRYVRASQKASTYQKINTTEVTIEYSRPMARGRTLFGPGGLEEWGVTWTPGANEATTIEFSKDVKVQGQELEAGEYSVWTVLGPDEWKVIFNSAADVWHLPYKHQDTEILEVTAVPQEGAHMEALAWYFPTVGPDTATLVVHWGRTLVPLHIEVEQELPVRPKRGGG